MLEGGENLKIMEGVKSGKKEAPPYKFANMNTNERSLVPTRRPLEEICTEGPTRTHIHTHAHKKRGGQGGKEATEQIKSHKNMAMVTEGG